MNDINRNKNIREFFILTIAQIIFQFLYFIRWFLLINYLNVINYGYYSIVSRFCIILTPLVSLGIGNALVIYIPKITSKSTHTWNYDKKSFFFLGFSISTYTIISLILYHSGLVPPNSYLDNFYAIIVFCVIFLVVNNFMYLYFIAHSNINFAGIFLIISLILGL